MNLGYMTGLHHVERAQEACFAQEAHFDKLKL